MPETIDLLIRGVVMGVTGSALMDAWSAVLRRRFGIPTLDYRLLGRWIGHFPKGRFVHERIAAAEPVAGERAIGWLAHYAIGVTFAFLLLAIWGSAWLDSPFIWPALAVGIATVVAPWFVMQPAMGVGVAGSKSTDPAATRLRNLGTHTVYGVGLYVAAALMSVLAG
ncbi:MAG TPA: DUF2938 domain-containing protein [Candidatus Limnocylindrales bacterium]|nr:DUF2938 domain-containing protein [Candidatus Limnocylindrales bacterium]